MNVKNRCHFDPSNCSFKLDGESSKSDLEICVFGHTDVTNRMFQFERYFHYIDWMTYYITFDITTIILMKISCKIMKAIF